MPQETLEIEGGPGPPDAAARAGSRIPVLLPYPFAGPFDYAVPPHAVYTPGDIVLVPLNRRQEVGVVWDAPSGPSVPAARLKPITARLDAPRLPNALRRFVDWVAGYTLAAPGEVLAMALRVNALSPPVPTAGWQLSSPLPDTKLTEARRRVLAVLTDGVPRTAPDLARAAGASSAVIRAMADAGLLMPTPIPAGRAFEAPRPDHVRAALSPDQGSVAATLRQAVHQADFSVTLLDGVTGSGKTEVYLEAVAACLTAGRQSLILLPEIALSAQFLDRFERRFGVAPALWHSDLTSGAAPPPGGGGGRPGPGGGGGAPPGPRCSCHFPSLGWWWSTRSTRPPSSRRTGSSITRATWRWSVPGCQRRRRSW